MIPKMFVNHHQKSFDHQALFFFEPCLRHRSLSKGQLSHQRVWNHDRFGDQSWFNMQVVRPFRVRLRVWWVSEKEIVLKLKVMEFFTKKKMHLNPIFSTKMFWASCFQKKAPHTQTRFCKRRTTYTRGNLISIFYVVIYFSFEKYATFIQLCTKQTALFFCIVRLGLGSTKFIR